MNFCKNMHFMWNTKRTFELSLQQISKKSEAVYCSGRHSVRLKHTHNYETETLSIALDTIRQKHLPGTHPACRAGPHPRTELLQRDAYHHHAKSVLPKRRYDLYHRHEDD